MTFYQIYCGFFDTSNVYNFTLRP